MRSKSSFPILFIIVQQFFLFTAAVQSQNNNFLGFLAYQYVKYPKSYPLLNDAYFASLQNLPFDGLIFSIERNNGSSFSESLSVSSPISYTDLSNALSVYQKRNALGWGKLKYNWLALLTEREQGDWFGDKGDRIVNNFKLAGRFVTDAKLYGLWFDAEGYSQRLFQYSKQSSRKKFSFKEYKQRIRERAKEIALSWVHQNPNFVIMVTHGYEFVYWVVDANGKSEKNWDISEYGLYGSFLDGLLDGFAEYHLTNKIPFKKHLIISTEETYTIQNSSLAVRELRKTAGKVDPRFKGSSPYYNELTDFGGAIWLDPSGKSHDGSPLPTFNAKNPEANFWKPAQLKSMITTLRSQGPFIWFFLHHIGFVRDSEHSKFPPFLTEYLNAAARQKNAKDEY